ncbi:MAG: 23S rRNA (uracil(1939)-C(5))-methyltransferase RlmD [Actinobacteria bacterium]|nr:23S rRNA (uracil(1939)-C(5))-methyltransferase RlmD [Actinomycetota bacterium]
MGRRKKRIQFLVGTERDVVAGQMNWKGRFVTQMEEGRALVSGAYPGFPCRVEFGRTRKKDIKARVVEYINKPAYATDPLCDQFNICGGCSLQHFNYEAQCKQKKDLFVRDNGLLVEKLSEVKDLKFHSAPADFHYRNKMEFSFIQHKGGEKSLGLHEQGRFQSVLSLETCWIQHPWMDKVFKLVSSWFESSNISGYNPWSHDGILRHLVLRGSSDQKQVLVNLVVTRSVDQLKYLYDSLLSLPEVAGVYETIHAGVADAVKYDSIRHLGGKLALREKVGHCLFDVGPRSFYQTNSEGMFVLYDAIENLLLKSVLPGLNSGQPKLLDLYCGAGSIGIFLSRHFTQVLGIEEVEEAVELAKTNARLNSVNNLKVFQGQVEHSQELLKLMDGTDVLIVDPPRSGCHPKARQWIRQLKIPWLIYVSCNPKTLQENIRDFMGLDQDSKLSGKYELMDMELVDLFPQTPHLESISLLRLRDET